MELPHRAVQLAKRLEKGGQRSVRVRHVRYRAHLQGWGAGWGRLGCRWSSPHTCTAAPAAPLGLRGGAALQEAATQPGSFTLRSSPTHLAPQKPTPPLTHLPTPPAPTSRMECIESCGAPMSTVRTPRLADRMGPMVLPQGMSLRTANSAVGTPARRHTSLREGGGKGGNNGGASGAGALGRGGRAAYERLGQTEGRRWFITKACALLITVYLAGVVWDCIKVHLRSIKTHGRHNNTREGGHPRPP